MLRSPTTAVSQAVSASYFIHSAGHLSRPVPAMPLHTLCQIHVSQVLKTCSRRNAREVQLSAVFPLKVDPGTRHNERWSPVVPYGNCRFQRNMEDICVDIHIQCTFAIRLYTFAMIVTSPATTKRIYGGCGGGKLSKDIQTYQQMCIEYVY